MYPGANLLPQGYLLYFSPMISWRKEALPRKKGTNCTVAPAKMTSDQRPGHPLAILFLLPLPPTIRLPYVYRKLSVLLERCLPNAHAFKVSRYANTWRVRPPRGSGVVFKASKAEHQKAQVPVGIVNWLVAFPRRLCGRRPWPIAQTRDTTHHTRYLPPKEEACWCGGQSCKLVALCRRRGNRRCGHHSQGRPVYDPPRRGRRHARKS